MLETCLGLDSMTTENTTSTPRRCSQCGESAGARFCDEDGTVTWYCIRHLPPPPGISEDRPAGMGKIQRDRPVSHAAQANACHGGSGGERVDHCIHSRWSARLARIPAFAVIEWVVVPIVR